MRSKRGPGLSRRRHLAIGITLILILPGTAPAGLLSETSPDLAACVKIEDDAKRLNCYDSLSGRKPRDPAPTEEFKETTSPPPDREFSYFSKLWELHPESRRGNFAIVPHRSSYVLPFTYNDSPNNDAVPGKELKRPEVKFQLSIKTKIWQDLLGKDLDLWFGYTQQSFWQFYDFDDSSPFRETNYEPELILNYRTDYDLLGWKSRFLNLAFNHQSNGRSEPQSRSWNRIIASAGFERKNFSLLLKGWYRLPESAEDDDNPHMGKYLGYGEIWGYYFWKRNRFGVMLRNNVDFRHNRGALQAEWSFPLFKRVGGYVQYFYGFGESLLDYNYRVNRIGIGFILQDWH